MGRKYKENQIDWINENIHRYHDLQSFTDEYNKVFGERRSVDAMRVQVKNRAMISLPKSDKFTEMEKEWLIRNGMTMNASLLVKEYSSMFPYKCADTLIKFLKKNNIDVIKCNIRHTDNERQWLKENFDNYSNIGLTTLFNKVFDKNLSTNAILGIAYSLGCKRGRYFCYTKEQKEWLANNKKQHTYKKLTEMFNAKFTECVTENSIYKVSNKGVEK